jgi:hypothetical protein
MKLVLALQLALAPAAALACPVCARDNNPYLPILLGAMIAVPYAITAVVVRAIRGGGR